ncbi:MAG: extracellular solute-binding protein [Lachnospiraceae bacterium]|nr:extracellular solute-binding protein [Lachnospiraceae bacterium]
MVRIKNYKNVVLSIVCLLLLLLSWAIYSDEYQKLPIFDHEAITIGVFSDSYWEVQNGYSYRILEDAIAIFEEQNPGVRVEYVSGILKEDYSEWLSEQLLSGQAPDIFFVLPDDFNDFAEVGALKDLTPIIGRDKDFDADCFFSSAYQYGQYNGGQYSLPYECAPKLMFVNRTILDKENIELPRKEWTWDEFYQICEAVTRDTDGNGMLDQFGVVNYTWEEAFESNGIMLFDQKGTRCYLADEKVEPALVFIEKLQEINKEYRVTTNDFDLGNVVFQPMSFSEYRAYKPYPLSIKKYSGFEWECIPMPAGPDGDNISTLDTLLIAMNENTRNPQYAWDFMKILTCNAQIQSEIFDYSEGVSVLREVTESEDTLRLLMESSGEGNSLNLQILSDAVENAVVTVRFRNYAEAVAEVDRAVDAIIEGNSNIHMEQIIWNRKINKFLKE